MANELKAGSGLPTLFRQKRREACMRGSAAIFWPDVFKRRLHTKIIIETGKTIVLRTKYRDIWERETLKRNKWVMGPWIPEPYQRLGAFVETIETGKTIVLRAKYRDIWEGERVKLKRNKWVMGPWVPELYKRLGAFVETDAGQASGRPLYSSNEIMGENEVIAITDLSFKDALQLKTKVKRSTKQSVAFFRGLGLSKSS